MCSFARIDVLLQWLMTWVDLRLFAWSSEKEKISLWDWLNALDVLTYSSTAENSVEKQFLITFLLSFHSGRVIATVMYTAYLTVNLWPFQVNYFKLIVNCSGLFVSFELINCNFVWMRYVTSYCCKTVFKLYLQSVCVTDGHKTETF